MKLQNKKVLAIVADEFEDLEHWYPIHRLREDGAKVDIAGEKANKVYIGKNGVPSKSDCSYNDVNAKDYDALIIPGGFAPDKMRRSEAVKQIVQDMDKDKKVIGQICHAGWVTISAQIMKGRKATSTPAIKDDVLNAGAEWVDEEVVIDDNLISSRNPNDLPVYGKTLVDEISKR